nr:hypothetical protein [Kribbella sandramycini]
MASLALTIPLAGWWTTRSDYKSWYDSEPRDAITVADGGTEYLGATWFAASVEKDPQQLKSSFSKPKALPPDTTRIRVYYRQQVADVASLEGLGGCRLHLRAPDGRVWDQLTVGGEAFEDRPNGCTGGYDEKPSSFRGANAEHYLKPQAGKPYETVAIFVVPTSVADSVQPTITWATKVPEYLAFPR